MKKILLLITSFVFLTFGANAGVNVGVSGMILDIDTDGTETLKQNNVKAHTTVHEEVAVPEIFIEMVNDGGIAVGVAVIPGEAELGSRNTTRTDKLTSGSSSVTQKAQAEISGHVTLYAIVPVMDIMNGGVYLKGGVGSVDVESNETLGTGASYGNQSVDFITAGVGYQKDVAVGFVRAEVGHTSYDKVSLKSTGSDAVSTITGDISHTHAKISIGKAF